MTQWQRGAVLAVTVAAFAAGACSSSGKSTASEGPDSKAVSFALARDVRSPARGSSKDLARFSYEHGCLAAYRRLCEIHPGELERSQCFEEGMGSCEKNALGFKEWLTVHEK